MDQRSSIIISPLARLDLEEIWVYTFKTWSIVQADKYQDQLFEGIESIATGSSSVQSLDNIKMGYKQCKINHHYIVFKAFDTHINVVRVLHEKMDLPMHLE